MNVNGLIAFGAGLLSFFSPCVLPLVPSFLIYISGTAINDYTELLERKHRKRIIVHSIVFIVGFSLVFVSFGFSSSFLGNLFNAYQTWIMRIGGALLIVMGLNMLNVLKIPFLNREKLVHVRENRVGLAGSFLIGITFSLGWTPCIGPILSTILLISATSHSAMTGVYLLSLYSLGLAVPFFISALLIGKLLGFMRRWGHIVRYTSIVLAIFLICIGVLLLSGYYTSITRLVS